jgi:erythromycin esterase-like protein
MLARRVALIPVLLALSAVLSAQAGPGSAESVQALRNVAIPLDGSPGDYDALLELVGDSRFVLLGEATHGSREFYRERARLTQRLILEKQFTVVAIEAEWRDAYDVNEYIHGRGESTPARALATFARFPYWMWRNRDVESLVAWLREYNASPGGAVNPVGVLRHGPAVAGRVDQGSAPVLPGRDPGAAARALERYACLTPHASRFEAYGRAIAFGGGVSCAPAPGGNTTF